MFASFALGSAAVGVAPPAQAQSETDDAKAVAELAKKHFQKKNYDMAARLYVRAYEMSQRPNLLFNAARAREQQGDRAEAIRLYRQYVAVETNVAGREEGRARMEALRDKMGDKTPASDSAASDSEAGGDKAAKGKSVGKDKTAAKDRDKDQESAKREPVPEAIPSGGLHLNKTVPFDKSGLVHIGAKLGPLTVNEVVIHNMPSPSEVADSLKSDPNDNSRPKFALGISNKSNTKFDIKATVRLETSDGSVLYSCERSDSVDRRADNDHTNMCGLFTSIKTRQWPKIAQLRVTISATPD
ncbi:MAG: hypothetical protein EXR77_14135 [Myxococcales bacterium]|nr:hypothetical protein [Myxococcales bacterium]